jgi:hypothetical protein
MVRRQQGLEMDLEFLLPDLRARAISHRRSLLHQLVQPGLRRVDHLAQILCSVLHLDHEVVLVVVLVVVKVDISANFRCHEKYLSIIPELVRYLQAVRQQDLEAVAEHPQAGQRGIDQVQRQAVLPRQFYHVRSASLTIYLHSCLADNRDQRNCRRTETNRRSWIRKRRG